MDKSKKIVRSSSEYITVADIAGVHRPAGKVTDLSYRISEYNSVQGTGILEKPLAPEFRNGAHACIFLKENIESRNDRLLITLKCPIEDSGHLIIFTGFMEQ